MRQSDEQIMRAAADDPAQFGLIFDRHFAQIHGYLARRLGRDRADDLAGEVFRVAFTKKSTFDPAAGTVRGWLYGIANNVFRRHLRDGERAQRAWARVTAAPIHDETDDVHDQVDARLRSAVMHRALDGLRPDDRNALLLFAVESLTYAEIAHLVGVPLGTVQSRISRARRQMREAMRPAPVASSQPKGDKHA